MSSIFKERRKTREMNSGIELFLSTLQICNLSLFEDWKINIEINLNELYLLSFNIETF